MQEFDECLTFEILARALGVNEIALVDKMALSAEHEKNHIAFSAVNHPILQRLDFFKARKHEFNFVQNGEFLVFEHLDVSKSFIAYEKERSGFNTMTQKELHDVYAYKPN